MPVTILVADDSATMRKIVEMTFAGEDAKVLSAETGEAALRKIAETRPDVVLVDAALPGTDGYELSLAVRNNAEVSNTAVILLASQHTPYDAERGRACGVDDHILKPFDSQLVIDRIKQMSSKSRSGTTRALTNPPASSGSSPPSQPRTSSPTMAGMMPPSTPPARPPVRATMAFGSPVPGAMPGQTLDPSRPQAPPPPPPRAPSPSGAGISAPMAPRASSRPVLELAEDEPFAQDPPIAKTPSVRPMQPSLASTASSGNSGLISTGTMAKATAPMSAELTNLGLSQDQVEAVMKLSREVVERVVWEVVPDLAETIIREEIKRLTAE